MKLGPVTKFDKRNQEAPKNEDDARSTNCGVIVNFLYYGQFGAIKKPDSGRIVFKFYILIDRNLLFYEN